LKDPQKLDYHSTECIYSPTAYRGHARTLVKDLEALRPSSIIDIIYSGEAIATQVKTDVRRPTQRTCTSCGSLSSQPLCQACALLATLSETALT
jgi:cytoplasmic tRNA 2-thiolation protein 1